MAFLNTLPGHPIIVEGDRLLCAIWLVWILIRLSFLQGSSLFLLRPRSVFVVLQFISSKSRSCVSETYCHGVCSSGEVSRSSFVHWHLLHLSRVFFARFFNWFYFEAFFMLFCFCLYINFMQILVFLITSFRNVHNLRCTHLNECIIRKNESLYSSGMG